MACTHNHMETAETASIRNLRPIRPTDGWGWMARGDIVLRCRDCGEDVVRLDSLVSQAMFDAQAEYLRKVVRGTIVVPSGVDLKPLYDAINEYTERTGAFASASYPERHFIGERDEPTETTG